VTDFPILLAIIATPAIGAVVVTTIPINADGEDIVIFTVSAIDADTVTVKQDGEVAKLPADAAASDDPQQAMVAQMMDGLKMSESSLTGTAKISRKDGKLLSAESTVKFKLAGEAQGQQMEMAQTAKSKVSRLAKLPEPAKKPDAKPADKPADHPADKPADAPAGPK